MTTTIKLPLRNLNAATMRALKFKYPQAEISLEVHSDATRAPLGDPFFWEIVGLFDWSKAGDDEAVLEPAIRRLAKGAARHIYEFADLLSEKLFALDARRFALEIGEDAWSAGRYFSVDNFLYARCCAVANGPVFYENVRKTPSSMPKDMAFEALLYLPSTAYERKTGRHWDYSPAFPIETYSNKSGWK